MSSESFRQQRCSSSSAILILYSPQKLLRIGPDRRLALLSRRRGAGGHDLFSDRSLQEWAAWAGAAELQATAVFPAVG